MQRRQLGQGLQTSALGLGCMGMTFAYAGADEARSLATIDRALEQGIDLLDTADIYGPETNERLLARVLDTRRDDIVLATKFGARSLEDPDRGPDSRPDYVHRACDASLRRLGVEVIDLYYQHRVDPRVPIEETVGAMAELVSAGKVRYLGLSEAGADTIRRAHAVHPITAVQTELSLWTREVQREVLPALTDLGIGLVAYSPLGRGFLTGKIRTVDDLDETDGRRRHPRFQQEAMAANLRLVELVEEVATQHDATAAQVALAWVLAQGDTIVPIPGTTRPERIDENVAALDLTLDADTLRRLDDALPPQGVAGTRYPEPMMRFLET
ncbi:aldo/keto reductase [Egicoccus sp. AB-alg6-2]|uniref:aldo/keto reductase n=1 Tax=Egicoccus sp. AB-alg6-2 TaxID=3242692 RepID=UPI00359D16A1